VAVLQHRCKEEEVGETVQQALDKMEEAPAGEPPDILTSFNSLACRLQAQGKHELPQSYRGVRKHVYLG
jgi:hypothetical protein